MSLNAGWKAGAGLDAWERVGRTQVYIIDMYSCVYIFIYSYLFISICKGGGRGHEFERGLEGGRRVGGLCNKYGVLSIYRTQVFIIDMYSCVYTCLYSYLYIHTYIYRAGMSLNAGWKAGAGFDAWERVGRTHVYIIDMHLCIYTFMYSYLYTKAAAGMSLKAG